MTENLIKIGLDSFDETVYAARVKINSARPEVKALIRLNKSTPLEHPLLEDGQVIMAVPDNLVNIKKVQLSKNFNYNFKQQAKFELAQTVLEDEVNFDFDIISSRDDKNLLGTIVRKENLRKTASNYNLAESKSTETNFCLRSAALGKGYINFCHQETGDLICLVDFNSEIVSICFVYQNDIVSVGHINRSKFNLENDKDINRLASELTTVLNYNVANLFEDGITIPLSAIIIISETKSEQLIEDLQKYFSFKISIPRINSGFFENPSKLTEIPINNYLIPLGLCID